MKILYQDDETLTPYPTLYDAIEEAPATKEGEVILAVEYYTDIPNKICHSIQLKINEDSDILDDSVYIVKVRDKLLLVITRESSIMDNPGGQSFVALRSYIEQLPDDTKFYPGGISYNYDSDVQSVFRNMRSQTLRSQLDDAIHELTSAQTAYLQRLHRKQVVSEQYQAILNMAVPTKLPSHPLVLNSEMTENGTLRFLYKPLTMRPITDDGTFITNAPQYSVGRIMVEVLLNNNNKIKFYPIDRVVVGMGGPTSHPHVIYHPERLGGVNVFTEGCLGTFAELIVTALNENDWYALQEAIGRFLQSYNPTDPAGRLAERWADAQEWQQAEFFCDDWKPVAEPKPEYDVEPTQVPSPEAGDAVINGLETAVTELEGLSP